MNWKGRRFLFLAGGQVTHKPAPRCSSRAPLLRRGVRWPHAARHRLLPRKALWEGPGRASSGWGYLANTLRAGTLPGLRPGTAVAAAERIRLAAQRQFSFICSISSSSPDLFLSIAAAAWSRRQPCRWSLGAPCSRSPCGPPAFLPPTRLSTKSPGPPQGRALLGITSRDKTDRVQRECCAGQGSLPSPTGPPPKNIWSKQKPGLHETTAWRKK